MDMEFWDFTPEERREWRALDVTKAYVNELRKQHTIAVKTCLSLARGPDYDAAPAYAGAAEGLDTAASIAGEDK